MDEIVLPLPNGGTLRCGSGCRHQWGGYVRICDQQENELFYWCADEVGDEPELVLGAIFSAAIKEI